MKLKTSTIPYLVHFFSEPFEFGLATMFSGSENETDGFSGFKESKTSTMQENSFGSVNEQEPPVSEESIGLSSYGRKEGGFGEGETAIDPFRAALNDKKEDGLRRTGDDEKGFESKPESFLPEDRGEKFGTSFGKKGGMRCTEIRSDSLIVGYEFGGSSFGDREDRVESGSFENKKDGDFQEKKEEGFGGFGSEVVEKMRGLKQYTAFVQFLFLEVNIGEKKEGGFGADVFEKKKEDNFGSGHSVDEKGNDFGASSFGEKKDGSTEEKKGLLGTKVLLRNSVAEGGFGSSGFGEKKESGFGSSGFGEKKGL
ncbi:unnamed protein product [Auanema sp. JU1783]|nr:unnamed protein product [Auanema sp. JU1783]